MSTLWGHKDVGSGVSVVEDELGAAVVYGDPDRIRTPPELGRVEHKVARVYLHQCPCGGAHNVKTFALEGTPMQVSECPARGYLWWKPRGA